VVTDRTRAEDHNERLCAGGRAGPSGWAATAVPP
jgi:hypothetical protein